MFNLPIYFFKKETNPQKKHLKLVTPKKNNGGHFHQTPQAIGQPSSLKHLDNQPTQGPRPLPLQPTRKIQQRDPLRSCGRSNCAWALGSVYSNAVEDHSPTVRPSGGNLYEGPGAVVGVVGKACWLLVLLLDVGWWFSVSWGACNKNFCFFFA